MGTAKRARQKAGRQARLEAAQAEQAKSKRNRTLLNVALLLVAFLVVAFVISRLVGGSSTETAATTTATSATTPSTVPTTMTPVDPTCPPTDGSAQRQTAFTKAPPMCIDPAKTYTAKVSTTKGDFTITFDTAKAPNTVNNFVFLARNKYYDGVAFHRIIPGFVVQGGDATGNPPGTGGPGYEFADELPAAGAYKVGSVAMANSGPNTNGSQFFVVTGAEGEALPPNYSLFGQVTEGIETVKALEAVGTPGAGTPTEDVRINTVTITEAPPAG